MASVTIDLGNSLSLAVPTSVARDIHRQLRDLFDTRTPAVPVGGLPDDHPHWATHAGGEAHTGPGWDAAKDLERATTYYSSLNGKAKLFLDLLIDHPGVRLDVNELIGLAPDAFTSRYAVAGAINGLRKAHARSGRRQPFVWWDSTPTQYGMQTSVAVLFRAAREAKS